MKRYRAPIPLPIDNNAVWPVEPPVAMSYHSYDALKMIHHSGRIPSKLRSHTHAPACGVPQATPLIDIKTNKSRSYPRFS